MAEWDVANTDATNIAMSCRRGGNNHVLDGEKWWATVARGVYAARPMAGDPVPAWAARFG